MSETTAAVDEPDTTIVTEFVYNEANSEKNSWKICNTVTLPRSEVVFVAQTVVNLILPIFCIQKLSFTILNCAETSVWFLFFSAALVTLDKSEDMIKMIDTSTRFFMTIVGPSGSGKTKLIFELVMGSLFYPKFETALYLYKKIQPVFSENKFCRGVNLKFTKLNGFESVRNLEKAILVFDDSCKEINYDKELVRLAIAGRHRGIDVIYVEHKLFH